MTKIVNVRNITKFRRSVRAISPVIATLLMIAIAVVASLVVYAWINGYMNFQTEKAGQAIALPSVAGVVHTGTNIGNLITYVQNVGQGTVEVSAVYVDDELQSDVVYNPSAQIPEGNTIEITINGNFNLDERHDIKVTTTSGTSMTLSKVKPGTGGTPGTPTASISLNPTSGEVGTTVTVSGSNFAASTLVTSTTFDGAPITTSPASITTDPSGAFSGVTFNVPSTTTGQKTVTFTAGTSASRQFTVTSPSMLNPNVPAPTLSQTTITLGNEITAQVTVTGSGATPTGQVTFQYSTDGNIWTDISTETLSGGSATSDAFQPSAVNTYSIHVVYNGDSVYNGAIGLSATLTVENANPENFGLETIGTSGSSDFGSIRGSRATTSTGGTAQSITAYLTYTPSSAEFGTTSSSSSGSESIENIIRGQIFTTTEAGVAQSIDAYVYTENVMGSSPYHLMKAAIFSADGNLIATTNELNIAEGYSNWATFTFASPPTLTASTQYILVVWSENDNGACTLRYTSGTGAGRYVSQTYGNWPTSATFSTDTRNYCINCNYLPTSYKAQAAIYSSDGSTRLAITEEKTLTTANNGWVTFNFIGTGPTLSASTGYVLMVWASDDSNVVIPYNSGGVRYQGNGASYNTWPNTVTYDNNARTYSVYCTYLP